MFILLSDRVPSHWKLKLTRPSLSLPSSSASSQNRVLEIWIPPERKGAYPPHHSSFLIETSRVSCYLFFLLTCVYHMDQLLFYIYIYIVKKVISLTGLTSFFAHLKLKQFCCCFFLQIFVNMIIWKTKIYPFLYLVYSEYSVFDPCITLTKCCFYYETKMSTQTYNIKHAWSQNKPSVYAKTDPPPTFSSSRINYYSAPISYFNPSLYCWSLQAIILSWMQIHLSFLLMTVNTAFRIGRAMRGNTPNINNMHR